MQGTAQGKGRGGWQGHVSNKKKELLKKNKGKGGVHGGAETGGKTN